MVITCRDHFQQILETFFLNVGMKMVMSFVLAACPCDFETEGSQAKVMASFWVETNFLLKNFLNLDGAAEQKFCFLWFVKLLPSWANGLHFDGMRNDVMFVLSRNSEGRVPVLRDSLREHPTNLKEW